ncbi:PIN domain nuclease [Kitasatospora sp. NPDC101183]|uniref:PIN domain nuclease n=1 Tax=Kitasatospora sp. NPDC101183 TaxID=3364100 RepID=UPI00381431E1
MSEEFLIDTSALVRLMRGQTGSAWDEAVTAGLVLLCEPVRQEYLRAVGGRTTYFEAVGLLRELFPYQHLRDDVWQVASELQERLAQSSRHQCASPVDLLVAVTAAQHKLTVLHQDADFETIAGLTGQPVRRIC